MKYGYAKESEVKEWIEIREIKTDKLIICIEDYLKRVFENTLENCFYTFI